MANLKRNMIELVEEVKEGEVITKKYLTPPFIPFSVVYQAMDLMEESEKEGSTERDLLDKMFAFVAEEVYSNQFTKDDLFNKLHAPDGIAALQAQILFIAQGEQSADVKNYLAKGN